MKNQKLKLLLFLALSFPFFTGCTSLGAGGAYSQAGDDVYEIWGGYGFDEPDESFTRGAFEICKKERNRGFSVTEKRSEGTPTRGGYLLGRVKCAGKVDSFLEKKYAQDGQTFQTSPGEDRSFVGLKKFDREFRLRKNKP